MMMMIMIRNREFLFWKLKEKLVANIFCLSAPPELTLTGCRLMETIHEVLALFISKDSHFCFKSILSSLRPPAHLSVKIMLLNVSDTKTKAVTPRKSDKSRTVLWDIQNPQHRDIQNPQINSKYYPTVFT